MVWKPSWEDGEDSLCTVNDRKERQCHDCREAREESARLRPDVFAHGKAPRAGAEILVAGAADIGTAGKKKKPICDGVYEAAGNIEAPAVENNVIPKSSRSESACDDLRCSISGALVARRQDGRARVASHLRQARAQIPV